MGAEHSVSPSDLQNHHVPGPSLDHCMISFLAFQVHQLLPDGSGSGRPHRPAHPVGQHRDGAPDELPA